MGAGLLCLGYAIAVPTAIKCVMPGILKKKHQNGTVGCGKDKSEMMSGTQSTGYFCRNWNILQLEY